MPRDGCLLHVGGGAEGFSHSTDQGEWALWFADRAEVVSEAHRPSGLPGTFKHLDKLKLGLTTRVSCQLDDSAHVFASFARANAGSCESSIAKW